MIYLVGMAMVLLFAVCCALLRQLNVQQKSQAELIDRIQTMAQIGMNYTFQAQTISRASHPDWLPDSTTGENE